MSGAMAPTPLTAREVLELADRERRIAKGLSDTAHDYARGGDIIICGTAAQIAREAAGSSILDALHEAAAAHTARADALDASVTVTEVAA